MPRRPSKKAGQKKTKGLGKPPRGVDRRDASIGRWETVDDIPMDEEDQFDARRDKVLLEGEEPGASDDGDEDEVFALEGMDQPSKEDEDNYGYKDEDEEPIAPPKAFTSKKKQNKGAPPSSSSSSEEDEEDESWGAKKSAYYADNADLIDSDDEEANELEEAEARRLQLRARAALDEEDFGIGELSLRTPHTGDSQADELDIDDTIATSIPTDKSAIIRHLEQTNPETLALARDWELVANAIAKAQVKMDQMIANPSSEPLAAGMLHLYHQTLLSYAANLAFYLHLRASPTHAAHPERLRDHPVMLRLLSLKQALVTLEELDFAPSDSDQSDLSGDDLNTDLDDMDEFDFPDDPLDVTGEDLAFMTPAERNYVKETLYQKMLDEQKRGGLEGLDISSMFDIPGPDGEAGPSKPKNNNPTKMVVEEADTPAPAKVKKKGLKAKPVFDLVEPDFGPGSSHTAYSSTPKPGPSYGDAFGELNALPAVDAEDKRARKRSLQFYTARVNKSGVRREGAAAANAGGDEDLPYKPRDRKKVERGTRGLGGEDLETEVNGAEEKKGTKRPRDEDDRDAGDAGEGEDGYYELVKKRGKERKEAKRTAYEAERAADRAALADSSGDADGGHRGISRAILKNRGLTPKRSKAVRNPRVKKRMRYDQAQKKVASQRPVFKAGVDASSYAGEKTGISRVIKSTKL